MPLAIVIVAIRLRVPSPAHLTTVRMHFFQQGIPAPAPSDVFLLFRLDEARRYSDNAHA